MANIKRNNIILDDFNLSDTKPSTDIEKSKIIELINSGLIKKSGYVDCHTELFPESMTTTIHKNGDISYDINCLYKQYCGKQHIYSIFNNDTKQKDFI